MEYNRKSDDFSVAQVGLERGAWGGWSSGCEARAGGYCGGVWVVKGVEDCGDCNDLYGLVFVRGGRLGCFLCVVQWIRWDDIMGALCTLHTWTDLGVQ